MRLHRRVVILMTVVRFLFLKLLFNVNVNIVDGLFLVDRPLSNDLVN